MSALLAKLMAEQVAQARGGNLIDQANNVSGQQAGMAAQNTGGKVRRPASPLGRAIAGSVRPRVTPTKSG